MALQFEASHTDAFKGMGDTSMAYIDIGRRLPAVQIR